MKDFLNEGKRYIPIIDITVRLASQLLQKKFHLIGTLKGNRKGNSKELVERKLKQGEIIVVAK